ncbi:MAG: phosphopyruvate hydratase [Clostridia bacterium]|nr:phosphopyruvate hydratase [Clostridia bacterium]
MSKVHIAKVCAKEILDSRGNPTVEATVFLSDGTVGIASVPAGASTGKHEANEKRDADANYYHGKGVLKAVYNVCRVISPAITCINPCEQNELDRVLCELDGTRDKSKLGANAILAVSLANARAAANHQGVPLYKHLGGINARRLPIPMMNILNGGAHAGNNVEIQEFMIVPAGARSFSEGIRMGSEIYHNLGNILKRKKLSSGVGDEGGFAPNLESDEEALELICDAIKEAGYEEKVKIALDCAASEWTHTEGVPYKTCKNGKEYTAEELVDYYSSLSKKYPIISIEDGLGEDDFDGWEMMTKKLGDNLTLVGDDLFVTNDTRLRDCVKRKIGNSILIKPNQIGTLSEVLKVIDTAKSSGYGFIISHRSGETEDTTLADIAVGTGAMFIKAGAPCRGERTAKYNRLLRIEGALSSSAIYGLGAKH